MISQKQQNPQSQEVPKLETQASQSESVERDGNQSTETSTPRTDDASPCSQLLDSPKQSPPLTKNLVRQMPPN